MMGMRKVRFVNNHFYHIFNRGVEKRDIFLRSGDYNRFIDVLHFYIFHPRRKYSKTQELLRLKLIDVAQLKKERTKNPLVDIINFCLMPNHFHLTLKQNIENGIVRYMQKVASGFSHYFNVLYSREGSLFQGKFRAVLISSEEQLIHLSRYVHLNPRDLVRADEADIFNYPWSTLRDYLGLSQDFNFCRKSEVLEYFKDGEDYKNFVIAGRDDETKEVLGKDVIDNDFNWKLD